MANDDDLIKQQGEDFNLDDEADFRLPDDPTDESGDHEYADDDIDLGLGDEEDLAFEESPDVLEDESGDESAAGEDTHDDEADEGEPKHKMGWKVYAGLALSVVIVAGGLSYMVMPSDKTAPSVTQNTPQAREIIRQRTDESIVQANQAATSPSQRPPVEIQAFPDSNAPDQTAMASPSAPASQGGMPQVPPANPGAGNSGPSSESFAVIPDPSESRFQLDNGSNVNAGDRRNIDPDGEFKALSDLANRNDRRITVLETVKSEKEDLSNLESRVLMIEKKLEQILAASNRNSAPTPSSAKSDREPSEPRTKSADEKTSVSKTTTTDKAETPESSGPVDYKPKVPKTAEEIKALQRQLAMYGYRPGKIDGIIGGNTREAIKRVQREHGLPVNSWLNLETLNVLVNPKHYSGTYPPADEVKYADHPRDEKTHTATWYVRGVTPSKAVVYRLDGMSYAVSIGTEIPGMGQVTALDPSNHEVRTVHGTIGKRAVR